MTAFIQERVGAAAHITIQTHPYTVDDSHTRAGRSFHKILWSPPMKENKNASVESNKKGWVWEILEMEKPVPRRNTQ